MKPGAKIIIKKSNQIFIVKEYPDSKEHVQDVYQIDEDEVYGEKIDWDKLLENLSKVVMGPEASEWRLRIFLIVNSFRQSVEESTFKQSFEKLFRQYLKDKEKAARILELQKLDSKFVKEEMQKDGIYLSDHEPEMLAYAMLYNYLAVDKIEVNLDESHLQTQELSQAEEVLESVSENSF